MIVLGDEAIKMFLNTEGTKEDIDSGLKAFLDYAAGKTTNDTFVQELDEAVKEAKQNREWRHEYMTLLMRDRENRKIGKEIGKVFGAISAYRDLRLSDEEIIIRLQKKFDLPEEQARAYMEEAE